MAVARSRREVTPYVLLCERQLPVAQQSRFLCRPLTAYQASCIDGMADISLTGGHARMRVGEQRWAALKAGLVGWENFNDENGQSAPFRRDPGPRQVFGIDIDSPPDDATINLLGPDVFDELADFIRASSKLTRADVGN